MKINNDENAWKPSYWLRELKRKTIVRFNWLKSNPKGLLKCLLFLFLIEYVLEFCMSDVLYSSPKISVILSRIMIGLFPIVQLSYIAEVFILYWLIDNVISKAKIPLQIELVINIALLVVFTTALYTISITSQTLSYYSSGFIFKLIFIEIYMNYRNLLNFSEITGLGLGPYFDIPYNIGKLWPVATIIVPLFYFVKKQYFDKKTISQAKSDQDSLDLKAYRQKLDKNYIKKHGTLKPDSSWHRFNLKVLAGLGYFSLYSGALLSTFLFSVIDWIFGVEFIIGDLIEMILMTIAGICLGLLGIWILKRKSKEIDDHYRISAYKINWRVNIMFTILLIFSIIGVFIPNDSKTLGPEEFSYITSTVLVTMITFSISLLLRKKYRKALKNSLAIDEESIS